MSSPAPGRPSLRRSGALAPGTPTRLPVPVRGPSGTVLPPLALWLLGVLLACLPADLRAQPLDERSLGELSLELLTDDVPGSPLALTHAGDERLFVTTQEGRVWIWDGDELLDEPFLDISDRVGTAANEQGLLSVAFHPDFPEVGFFFADYTDLAGNTVISRFRVSADPNRADPDSEQVLLNIAQPFSNHNGGQLQFGPDGFLYVGMGDGGNAFDPRCNAQDPGSLLGKILRLDVEQNRNQPPFFGIPRDNPFAADGGPRPEIWARGLRNPWRFSFDRQTGDLYIADVGQNAREEVSFQAAGFAGGANYGWKVMEGTRCLGDTSGCGTPVPPCDAPEYTDPVIEYANDGEDCAVVGGHVYRGGAIGGLDGVYFYGDFCSGAVRVAQRDGGAWESRDLGMTVELLSSFGEDLQGEIYLTSLQGSLFRLTGPAADDPGDDPDDSPPADPGRLELVEAEVQVPESAGAVPVTVRRSEGTAGEVSVAFETVGQGFGLGRAGAGEEYVPTSGRLTWADGEGGTRTVEIELLDDARVEPRESLRLELSDLRGGAELAGSEGGSATATVTLTDDDLEASPCQEGPATLCLQDGRFRVEARFATGDGTPRDATARPLTADTGFFWFFEPDNLEVVVKVVDACGPPFDRFWVFAGGLTDVAVVLTVVDTEAPAASFYGNPGGTAFAPVQDTAAFDTCP